MPRTFRPGQRADLFVIDVDTGERRRVHSSIDVLLEAPNWTPDGDWLVVNGDGGLFRIPVAGGDLHQIDLAGVPEINNDHVLSPDGQTVYVSAGDGHIYAVPFPGGGAALRVSGERGPRFRHYLHGISPDGATLSYIGLKNKKDGRVLTDVWTLPSAGGEDVRITDDSFPDDGAEFGPDGKWIYFNSERASRKPGHAQLFRIALDCVVLEQLTNDSRVNWFPHPSPDGRRLAYVSFPKGTEGHPADVDVIIRILESDRAVRDLVAVFGGQGTMNVPSWSPDGKQLAYVAYPIGK